MVLASNAWLNSKNDEQKPPAIANSIGSPGTEGGALNNSLAAANRIGGAATAAAGLQDEDSSSDQQPQQAIVVVGGGGGVAAAAGAETTTTGKHQRQRLSTKSKNHQKMEAATKKGDCLADVNYGTTHEKHETETREFTENIDDQMNSPYLQSNNTTSTTTTTTSNNTETDNNNVGESNNTSTGSDSGGPLLCDSNTNTLQNLTTTATTTTQQQQRPGQPPFTSQALHVALNNSNTTSTTLPTSAAVENLFNSMGIGGLTNNGALQQQQQQQQQLQETLGISHCNTLLNSQLNSSSMPTDMDSGLDITGEAMIVLNCEGRSHKFDTRRIRLMPNQECKVGRLIAKSKASEGNAIFDCKVLSRNHAVLWYSPDGRFWVKDTKSSNGTFINDNKLGSEQAELHFGDIVKFGVEVVENSRQEVHGCIIARVTLFLPDGREAISIDQNQVELTGSNRISFEEIQRLNAYIQETAQREKMLKAKLNSMQNVLDATRKNSAKCWQSMIDEDQLLHKINLLEKKLMVLEKNVPENSLRNEVNKMLEDKATYQETAKEALRKVYQERCEAMQMLAKAEMSFSASENECALLRNQMLTTKQTLHDFNSRLEQLQQENLEYKQETARQQTEAKEQQELQLQELREQVCTYERETEELRLQISQLQQTISRHDKEQELQQRQVMDGLDAVLGNVNDDDDDDDEEDDNDEDADEVNNDADDADDETELSQELSKNNSVNGETKSPIKEKVGKMEIKDRNLTAMSWLMNSDLNKGANGSDILNAIINNTDADSGEDEDGPTSTDAELFSAGASSPVVNKNNNNNNNREVDAADAATDEFVHESPKHHLNGNSSSTAVAAKSFDESEELLPQQQQQQEHNNKSSMLISQATLTTTTTTTDNLLLPEQALEMLEDECSFYKQKTENLSGEVKSLQDLVNELKQKVDEKESKTNITTTTTTVVDDDDDVVGSQSINDEFENDIADELAVKRNELRMESEEELIIYKERLEQSESSNLLLRNEISVLRLKQQTVEGGGGGGVGVGGGHHGLIRRALPLGCMALAAFVYFLTSRF